MDPTSTTTLPPSDDVAEERLIRSLERLARDLEHTNTALAIVAGLLLLMLALMGAIGVRACRT